MNLLKYFGKSSRRDNKLSQQETRLLFASTAALERALDGTDDAYQRYFFAIYHCSPDEPAGINLYREKLKNDNPKDAVEVGCHFVLWGNSAFQAIVWYYEALSNASTLPDELITYAKERLSEIKSMHEKSQGLGIDLSEGQLSNDPRLTFYACLALDNRQIILQRDSIV
ncbi:MAG: hypothetical protein AB9M53_09685 [Leptothrix sp. (in: b-proteobacteria)]